MSELPNSDNTQNGNVSGKKLIVRRLTESLVIEVAVSVFYASVIVVCAAVISHLDMPLGLLWAIFISGVVCAVTTPWLVEKMLNKAEDK